MNSSFRVISRRGSSKRTISRAISIVISIAISLAISWAISRAISIAVSIAISRAISREISRRSSCMKCRKWTNSSIVKKSQKASETDNCRRWSPCASISSIRLVWLKYLTNSRIWSYSIWNRRLNQIRLLGQKSSWNFIWNIEICKYSHWRNVCNQSF